MTGKITRANVEEYATLKGLELLEVDSIPEGFAWKSPDLWIGKTFYRGKIIKFKPLADWGDKDAIIYE
jgi:hypothetical protein